MFCCVGGDVGDCVNEGGAERAWSVRVAGGVFCGGGEEQRGGGDGGELRGVGVFRGGEECGGCGGEGASCGGDAGEERVAAADADEGVFVGGEVVGAGEEDDGVCVSGEFAGGVCRGVCAGDGVNAARRFY